MPLWIPDDITVTIGMNFIVIILYQYTHHMYVGIADGNK